MLFGPSWKPTRSNPGLCATRMAVMTARFALEPPVCAGQAALSVLPGTVVAAAAGVVDGLAVGGVVAARVGVAAGAVVAGATVGVGERVTVSVGPHAVAATKVSANSPVRRSLGRLICTLERPGTSFVSVSPTIW